MTRKRSIRRKNKNSSFIEEGGMKFSQNEKIKGKKNIGGSYWVILRFIRTGDVAFDNQAPDCPGHLKVLSSY